MTAHRFFRLREVSLVFLHLGLTSFGGPVAHLGYFYSELVVRRRWISEDDYVHLMGLCQALPGPASSQLGFLLGLTRAGWLGAFAAFFFFTAPSALFLMVAAFFIATVSGEYWEAAAKGLKLVAFVIVADAVVSMGKKFCATWHKGCLLVVALALLIALPYIWFPTVLVVLMAAYGTVFLKEAQSTTTKLCVNIHWSIGGLALVLWAGILTYFIVIPTSFPEISAFYQSGALVFGGGHVVLPWLESATVNSGWVSADEFLTGYGLAQAIPGPLFTFSAYLGVAISDSVVFASLCLLAIFLPGFLCVVGVLPFWQRVTNSPLAVGALSGLNVSVVGILAKALYTPIFISAIHTIWDIFVAVIGCLLLVWLRLSPLWAVAWCVGASLVLTVPIQ